MNRNVSVFFFALMLTVSASAKNLYIPIGGVAAGANNTLFRTDVRIFNPSATTPISISIHFQPAGMDGTNIPGRVVDVAPRQMVVLNDVVTFLQYPAPAIGAIRLDSDTDRSYEFIADSRTYTDSPNPAVQGTYGQFVPALDPASAVQKIIIQHLSHSTAYRTNAGAMNPGLQLATVTPRLYRADGTLVAQGAPFVVQPRSVTHLPLPTMFNAPIDFEDGYLSLDSDVPVFGYGSVVDNRSGDQIFVLGAEDRV